MGLLSKLIWAIVLFSVLFGGAYAVQNGFIQVDNGIDTENYSINDNITDNLKNVTGESNTVDTEINSSEVGRSYTYNINRNGVAKVVTKKRVDTEKSYNIFNQKFRIPDSTIEVTSVRDTNGELSYSRNGDVIKFSSRTDYKRNAELFTVRYRDNVTESNNADDVYTYDISSPSNPNESVSIKVKTARDILTVYMQSNHRYDVRNNTVVVRGKGPARFNVVVGTANYQTESVALFNNTDSSVLDFVSKDELSNDYRIARGVVGHTRDDVTHPVVIMNSSQFDEVFGDQKGVSGVYKGGIVYIPHSTLKSDSPNSVIAHELTHALNGQIGPYLPAWFDEGTATFVQAVTAKRYGELYVRPFETKQYYPEGCQNTRSRECKVVSSGTNPTELHNYISDNRTFMEERVWNTPTDFKYSYSNLVINIFVSETEGNSLRDIYKPLYTDPTPYRKPENQDSVTRILLKDIGQGSSLNPCQEYARENGLRFPSESTTKSCINEFDNVPKYPSSLSEEYSLYQNSLEHQEAKPP